MKPALHELLLATKDVARVLQVSTDLVRYLERRGVLPAQLLPSRQRVVRFVDAVQLARERGVAVDEPDLVAQLYGENVVPFGRPVRPRQRAHAAAGARARDRRRRRMPAQGAERARDRLRAPHGHAAVADGDEGSAA